LSFQQSNTILFYLSKLFFFSTWVLLKLSEDQAKLICTTMLDAFTFIIFFNNWKRHSRQLKNVKLLFTYNLTIGFISVKYNINRHQWLHRKNVHMSTYLCTHKCKEINEIKFNLKKILVFLFSLHCMYKPYQTLSFKHLLQACPSEWFHSFFF
jgi:hypothetical protein